MPRQRSHLSDEQADLFRPHPNRPAWTALPEQARSEVRALWAQLLRLAAGGRPQQTIQERAADE